MKCNNCDKTDSFRLFTKAECYWTKLPLNIVICNNCNLVFLNPRPDKSLGVEYFNQAYSGSKEFENHSYYKDHEKILARNKDRFEVVKKVNSPNKKILDYGAGQGHFIKICEENGWSTVGIEQSSAGINVAKQLFNINLLSTTEKLHENGFGVITLWDVIEHLENPKETLIMLSKFLHNEGVFIIETSNINSYDFLLYKEKWSYWHFNHYYYYSNLTINYLLNSIGFEIIDINKSNQEQQLIRKLNFRKYIDLFTQKSPGKIFKLLYYKTTKRNVSKHSLMTIIAKRILNNPGKKTGTIFNH